MQLVVMKVLIINTMHFVNSINNRIINATYRVAEKKKKKKKTPPQGGEKKKKKKKKKS